MLLSLHLSKRLSSDESVDILPAEVHNSDLRFLYLVSKIVSVYGLSYSLLPLTTTLTFISDWLALGQNTKPPVSSPILQNRTEQKGVGIKLCKQS
jgi:hypothetical protein